MEASNLVCTQNDMVYLNEKLYKMDLVDHCTRIRANFKWRFCKLTNVTIFTSLVKNLPMGFQNTVLPNHPLQNHHINCLTFQGSTRKLYKDHFSLFQALTSQLHSNDNLEEDNSKFSSFFL